MRSLTPGLDILSTGKTIFQALYSTSEQAETHWPHIDAGLDEAKKRGISQRFVWALPQISRDGYTRLPNFGSNSGPTDEDDQMQSFDDVFIRLRWVATLESVQNSLLQWPSLRPGMSAATHFGPILGYNSMLEQVSGPKMNLAY